MKAVDVFAGKMHICTYTSSFKRWGRGIFGREGRSKELLTILLGVPCPLCFNERLENVEWYSEPLDTRHPAPAMIKSPFISSPSFFANVFKNKF